jgi:hypothetical protein
MQKVVQIKGNDEKAEDAIDLIKISSKNKQIKIAAGIVTAMLKQITCKENESEATLIIESLHP